MIEDSPVSRAPEFLAGQGEMARRMRELDWSLTALGPAATWPQSLRSAVSILLPSKAQIILFWGPEFVVLYNDGYRSVFGAKHPWALGRPGREAWSEVWDPVLRDLFVGVVETGEAFWASDRMFVLERFGYPEETFFDVSYDPVRDESGAVGGVFCIVSETTGRVLSDRRLETLRELGFRTAEQTRSVDEACRNAAQVLSANRWDVPWSLLYLYDAETGAARLAESCGLEADSPAAPAVIAVGADDSDGERPGWPLRAVLESRRPAVVSDVTTRFGELPAGVWPEPVHTAVVLPIAKSGQERLAGFLIAGISPRRALDDQYRAFLDLVANQIASAVANAHAYEEERRRAQALAELDRAKTAFFSNVSHEFRTPLTLMLGPVEELLAKSATELSPAAASQLEVVHRNGQRLKRLVNTLLDFSRIEAGRVRASFLPTDLGAYTAELASVFRAATERAGLRLIVDCETTLDPVFVDRDMWEKVVLNLLSNAFKFTFEGEIEVSLHQHGNGVELLVRDTGTGIPEAEMPRIFERFHRVENARGRTHEGSGIGLALVQELIRLHGGTVSAESALGKGTTFRVKLPTGSRHLPPDQVGPDQVGPGQVGLQSAPASTATTAAPFVEEALRWLPETAGESDALVFDPTRRDALLPAPSSAAVAENDHRPRVLMVDDNADMRSYVARLLEQHYRVEAAPDGVAALAAVRRRRPDLILADVMMPRLDGFGLLRELRAHSSTRDLPVILLSARAGEESRVEGLDAGADDYLIKPFSARELLARVQSSLALSRVRREADRRKDEFLATLSHELRGPLAPMRNMLEILKHAESGDGLIEQARGTMERQLSSLVRLVDDLLDVSRITRNNLELRRERVELAAIVHQALETCWPLAESYEHELVLALPPEPIYLDADPVRLAQVFGNLCHNACKYSERRGRVEIKAERAGSEVVVRIKDRGLGIPTDQLDRIFEMFAQVDSTLERSRGGLGIGLTLVKRLVEMHGGTVTAHSEGRGSGSEFVVRLPILAETRAVNDAAQTGIVGAKPGAGRRILVVDDNQDSAHSLAALLEIGGNETHVATDGIEAIEAAERLRPDVVLLDIGMPRLNGYDACRRVRGEEWGKSLVMIALTGWGQEEDRNRSRAAGFDAHLVKPVDYVALMKLLESLSPAPAVRTTST